MLDLRNQERAAWRRLWVPRERMAVVKVPVVVPAGSSLTLSVPPESRGIIALYYDVEKPRPARVADGETTQTLRACPGGYPSVGFPGQLLVARRVCDVLLDYESGNGERGRLRLSFGGACRR